MDFVLGPLRSCSTIKRAEIVLVLTDVVKGSVDIGLAFWVLLLDALVRLNNRSIHWSLKVLLRQRLKIFRLVVLMFFSFARRRNLACWDHDSLRHEFWKSWFVWLANDHRCSVVDSLGLSKHIQRWNVTRLVLVWRFYFHARWEFKLLILELGNRWDMVCCLEHGLPVEIIWIWRWVLENVHGHSRSISRLEIEIKRHFWNLWLLQLPWQNKAITLLSVHR